MPELWCEIGEHNWDRPSQRGRRPRNCPEHMPDTPMPPRRKDDAAPVAENPEEIDLPIVRKQYSYRNIDMPEGVSIVDVEQSSVGDYFVALIDVDGDAIEVDTSIGSSGPWTITPQGHESSKVALSQGIMLREVMPSVQSELWKRARKI